MLAARPGWFDVEASISEMHVVDAVHQSDSQSFLVEIGMEERPSDDLTGMIEQAEDLVRDLLNDCMSSRAMLFIFLEVINVLR